MQALLSPKKSPEEASPWRNLPQELPFVKRPLARAVREADSVLRNGGISEHTFNDVGIVKAHTFLN